MRSALVTSTKMVAVFRPTDAGCRVVRPSQPRGAPSECGGIWWRRSSSSSAEKIKNEPTKMQEEIRLETNVAAARLGGRLDIRYSATREPNKERYNVQMIIANIKKEFAKDVLGGSGSSLWSECWTQMKMDI